MKAILLYGLLVSALSITSVTAAAGNGPLGASGEAANEWTNAVGNLYFSLQPGHTLVLGGTTQGSVVTLTITVLAETLKVDGVETRVVEQRKMTNGRLVEVRRGYFAASTNTLDVYCFGRDIETYNNGQLTGRRGSWRAGTNGARSWLIVPANPQVGESHGSEEGRVQILSLTASMQTAAGRFDNCVVMEESIPPIGKEYEAYAPGAGLVRDGDLLLERY